MADEPVNQPDRPLSPLGLYSHAGALATSLPQEKGHPDQFKAMLSKRGVKPDEIATSGYDQAFAGKKSVTKHDVARHFHENLPDVKETVLSNDLGAAAYAGRRDRPVGAKPPTKYHDYQLPGGSNYREHLLHLPPQSQFDVRKAEGRYRLFDNKANDWVRTPDGKLRTGHDSEDEARRAAQGLNETSGSNSMGNYQSSHWDIPNVLAHLRLSDRKGPKGEKILHLEELQSDWAQEGRKKGFAKDTKGWAAQRLNDPDAGFNHWQINDAAGNYVTKVVGGSEDSAIRKAAEGVPKAPYVDNTQKWVDLGLKRVLHEAAKGGYHKVVITPGEEQAKRYDLSKHIEDLTLHGTGDNMRLSATDKSGRKVIDMQHVTDKTLTDHIGKEAAEKFLAQPEPNPKNPYAARNLFGAQLKIGGEGMKAFYDTILPRSLEKLAKGHDPAANVKPHQHATSLGQVERGQQKLHSLNITPAMRASILRGQAAYAAGGAAIAKLPKATGGSVNHSPTDAQKAAGNYAKERVSFQGLPISIENKAGSTRHGVDAKGRRWSSRVPFDYGYIRGTNGADGDHVDCYIGPDSNSNLVVVVNQRKPNGSFDEHKCLLGFPSERDAVRCYRDGFSDGKGADRIGSVETMSVDAFKHWLKGKTTAPARSRSMVERALAIGNGR